LDRPETTAADPKTAAPPLPRGVSSVKAALEASLERYSNLVKHLPVGVYRTLPDGTFIEANAALAKMLGVRRPSELFRYNVKDFYVKSRDRDDHLEKLNAKPTYFTEFELRAVGGRRFWVRDYCRAVKGPEGVLLHFDGILVDVTERKRAAKKLGQVVSELQQTNAKLKEMALTDDLTGLLNRRGFFTLGLQQMMLARRMRKSLFLLYADVNELKSTNDRYGHATGDRVLVSTAGILKATLRESDVLSRLGGDEFAVLAIRSGQGGEKALLARLQERIEAHNAGRAKRFRVSLSMGLVAFDPKKYASLEEFLAQADYTMYRQKRNKLPV
jgi:diguanylate cyclase (GGDEF)-like protein/PAS domain S-box-containing protein